MNIGPQSRLDAQHFVEFPGYALVHKFLVDTAVIWKEEDEGLKKVRSAVVKQVPKATPDVYSPINKVLYMQHNGLQSTRFLVWHHKEAAWLAGCGSSAGIQPRNIKVLALQYVKKVGMQRTVITRARTSEFGESNQTRKQVTFGDIAPCSYFLSVHGCRAASMPFHGRPPGCHSTEHCEHDWCIHHGS